MRVTALEGTADTISSRWEGRRRDSSEWSVEGRSRSREKKDGHFILAVGGREGDLVGGIEDFSSVSGLLSIKVGLLEEVLELESLDPRHCT